MKYVRKSFEAVGFVITAAIFLGFVVSVGIVITAAIFRGFVVSVGLVVMALVAGASL